MNFIEYSRKIKYRLSIRHVVDINFLLTTIIQIKKIIMIKKKRPQTRGYLIVFDLVVAQCVL